MTNMQAIATAFGAICTAIGTLITIILVQLKKYKVAVITAQKGTEQLQKELRALKLALEQVKSEKEKNFQLYQLEKVKTEELTKKVEAQDKRIKELESKIKELEKR